MTNDAAGHISIRDQIVPVAEGRSVFDVLATIGVDAIELLVDFSEFTPYVRVTDGTAFSVRDSGATRDLKSRLDAEGVRCSALLVATDFSADDAESHVKWAVRVVEAARELGAPVVRVDTLTVKRTLPADAVRDNLVRRVRQVLELTADSGVDLGLENHGPLSNDEHFLDQALAELPDPRLGLTLDTGNFYWWGYPLPDVYRLIEKYAPRARHTHIKNVNYPPALAQQRREIGHEYKQYCSTLYEGNLDLKRVVALLRLGGYAGDFCIEDESLFKAAAGDRVEVLRRDANALRDAMK